MAQIRGMKRAEVRLTRDQARAAKRRKNIQAIQSILAEELSLDAAPTPSPPARPEEDGEPTPPRPASPELVPPVVRPTPLATEREVGLARGDGVQTMDTVNGRLLLSLKKKLFEFVMIVAGKTSERDITKYWTRSDVLEVGYANEILQQGVTGASVPPSQPQRIGAAVGVTYPVGRSNVAQQARVARIVSGEEFLMQLMQSKQLTSADVAAWKLIFQSPDGGPLGLSARSALLAGITLEQAFMSTYLSPPFYAGVHSSLQHIHTASRRPEITLHDLIYSDDLMVAFAELVTVNITMDKLLQSRTEHKERARQLNIRKTALTRFFANAEYVKPAPVRASDVTYMEDEVVVPMTRRALFGNLYGDSLSVK